MLAALLLSVVLAQAKPGATVNWDAWNPRDTPPENYPQLLLEPGSLGGKPYRLVDVRSEAEFSQEHIPGAVSLPARECARLTPAELSARIAAAGMGAADSLVVCGGRADPAAAGLALALLESLGLNTRVLNGGFEHWKQSGGGAPRNTSPPNAPPRIADPGVDSPGWVSLSRLREVMGAPGNAVLDWRPAEDWAAEHIPHALPFPTDELVDDSGAPLSGPELRDLFKQWGPRPQEYVSLTDTIVVLGDDPPGLLPIHPYLALRLAGVANVALCPEGWSGWRQAGYPKTRIVDAETVEGLLEASWGSSTLPDVPPPTVLLFDLRGVSDYRTARLPGAVWLPVNRFNQELDLAVQEYWPGADRENIPLIVYCYGPTCTRSRNATTMAARAGFRNLYWFKDGVQGWRRLNRPAADGFLQ